MLKDEFSREEKLEKIKQIQRQIGKFYPDVEAKLDGNSNAVSLAFTVGNPEEQEVWLKGDGK